MYLIKTKIKKIGANIKLNEITVSISYIKQKIQYYKNLDIKEVTYNKKFWKSVKSYFGKADSNSEKIMLLENNSIKTNEKEIAIIMNDYFINFTKNLDLKTSKKCTAKDLNSIVSEFDII